MLSQLDAVRRELVDVADRHMPHITFGREVVREVLAFAQVGAPRGPVPEQAACGRVALLEGKRGGQEGAGAKYQKRTMLRGGCQQSVDCVRHPHLHPLNLCCW